MDNKNYYVSKHLIVKDVSFLPIQNNNYHDIKILIIFIVSN